MAKEHLKYESTEIDRRLDLAGTALQVHQDISHLATKDEVDAKVDKVDGKGLSTEDFTTDEKNKLASLENYDDTPVKEDIATIKTGKQDVIKDLNTIREGASKGATALQSVPSEYVTKTQLDQKVDKISGKQLSTEDYTTAEKTKLRGLYNYDDTTVKASIKSVEDKVKTKQDIVQDLETIRQGASKGATAIQEVKTINGESIVGKGNIEIKGGGGSSYDDTEIKQNINELSAEVHEKLEGEVIATSEATEDFDFRYDDSEIRQELSELSDRMDDFTPSSITNVTWAELKALRDEGKLIAGQMYRMTDYETTCTWENTQVAGHPFDLVLTALDNKTLDEKCSAVWSERDTDGYFANSNLPAWDVRYCLDNDTERFVWENADGEYFTWVNVNGKGVIYRLIDEAENDVPYDFKNIMFKRFLSNDWLVSDEENGVCVFCYTLTFLEEGSEGVIARDASIIKGCHDNKFGFGCTNNVLAGYLEDNTIFELYGNLVSDCARLTLIGGAFDNQITNGYDIVSSWSFINNRIDNCNELNFLGDIYDNYLKNCYGISAGTDLRSCKFEHLTGVQFITQTGEPLGCIINTEMSYCIDVDIVCNETTSVYHGVNNYTIKNMNGLLEITKVGSTTRLIAMMNTNGENKIFNIADLVKE